MKLKKEKEDADIEEDQDQDVITIRKNEKIDFIRKYTNESTLLLNPDEELETHHSGRIIIT